MVRPGLTRLFREQLGTTPARYIESIRFDIAKSLLVQRHTATQAASLAGVPSSGPSSSQQKGCEQARLREEWSS